MTPRQARRLYTLAWWLGLPLVALYLLWRSLRQPEYRRCWAERFLGRGALPPAAGVTIWVHAVSVGETRAAQPLIEQLAAARPDASFVLTHMTPTGRAVGEGIVSALPGRVVQRYLPYELAGALDRFFSQTRPALGIVMETEIWPNLLHAAHARQVPIVLVNARLSEKSLARALRVAPLMRAAAHAITRVLAQTEADARRLATLYDGPIEVVGNLKFDLVPAPNLIAQGRALRQTLGPGPVWLAASTREGEEALILDALQRHLGADRAVAPTLLIVPRHPQRFDEVARLIEARGFKLSRRSRDTWAAPPPRDTVLLGDSMGELALYYGMADITLMGGSLAPFGAHNLIESCAAGTPVVLGPSTYNFALAARQALDAGAAVQASDADAALAALAALARDPAQLQKMRQAAQDFAAAHRGATAATVQRLLQMLPA